jgi:hypothetical protein
MVVLLKSIDPKMPWPRRETETSSNLCKATRRSDMGILDVYKLDVVNFCQMYADGKKTIISRQERGSTEARGARRHRRLAPTRHTSQPSGGE